MEAPGVRPSPFPVIRTSSSRLTLDASRSLHLLKHKVDLVMDR